MNSLKNPILDEQDLQKQIDSIEPETEQTPQDTACQDEDLRATESSEIFNKYSENALSKLERILPLLFLAVFLCGLFKLSASPVSASLHEYLSGAPAGEMVQIILVLKEQADSQELYRVTNSLPRSIRREQVISYLKKFSDNYQILLKSNLEELSRMQKASDIRYFWITNVISLKAHSDAIQTLAKHPSIERIEHDPLRQVFSISDKPKDHKRTQTPEDKRTETREIAANISLINAPQVWAQGFTGDGVVVGVIDSGVNYAHQDLAGRFWSHPTYPNYGFNFQEMNHSTGDFIGHGTHVSGTIAGNGNSGIATGVAPQSRIMILKMCDDAGFSTQNAVWTAIQFGVEYGADILNMSMGWQYSWNPDRYTWRNVMTNTMLAGVSSAVAIGNEGTAGLRTPGDCPPPWLHPDQSVIGGLSGTVSVGATNYQDEVAAFSSRGPASWATVAPFYDYPVSPGIGLTRPDIAAPGVDIVSLSSADSHSYATGSGTSFASPAVAGLMALMYDKKPNLTPEEVSHYIEESAVQLAPVKNNNTGSGRIDVLETVNSTGAYIDIHSHTLNGVINANPVFGQTATLFVELINYGYDEVENVNALLSTTDEYVTIYSNQASYGDIPGMAIAISPQSFVLSFAANTPHNHHARLVLNLSSEGGNEWQQILTLQVMAPKLDILIPIVNDSGIGGDGNGTIGAGETLRLHFPIHNSGGAASTAFSVDVQSTNPLAEINSVSNTFFPQLLINETAFPYLELMIAPSAQTGDELYFQFQISCGEHFFEGSFMATVGGVVTIQIGEGDLVNTTSAAAPVNIHYRSQRGQMVYTAQEILGSGALSSFGGTINNLGFFISSPPLYALPNFTIRMKHTTATDASAHDDGPFQTVLVISQYSPAASGWDFLCLSNPFEWNGVDNILIDISFSRTSSFDSSGQQRIFQSPNGYRFVRGDNADFGNSITTSLAQTKPQIAMKMAENYVFEGATNLSGQGIGTSIILAWDAPAIGNPESYKLFRNGIFLALLPGSQTEFTDEDVSHTSLYYYYLTSLIDGEETLPSNIAQVQSALALPLPLISPEESIHFSDLTVSISTQVTGAVIHYTTDGSVPEESSAIYSQPFIVTAYHTVIKARIFKPGHFPSETASREVCILRAPINFELSSGPGTAFLTWESNPYVSGRERNTDISTRRNGENPRRQEPDGYHIYRAVGTDDYQLVNDEPVSSNTFIDSGLPTGDISYYVTSVFEQGESQPSEAQSIHITGVLPLPFFTPAPGTYRVSILVQINTAMGQPEIFYTLDGTDPDVDSLPYPEEGITLSSSVTIKAIALQDGWFESGIATGNYIIENTSLEENIIVPQRTELKGAYPNPFNPVSTVHYSIAERGAVYLEVYSLKGQKVKTLVSGIQAPGEYRVSWQGEDENGRRAGSGIYFYCLRTGDYQKHLKVVMLK